MPKLPALRSIPGPVYLWLAILILGASSAITRKLTDIGSQHFMGGQNPISLCNVLFVGNLCALLSLIVIHRRRWSWATVRQLSHRERICLVLVASLSGALAPGLIFQALALTPVTNVILIGRLEPPLILALSVWVLHDRVSRWEVLGAIVAFTGIVLTVLGQPANTAMLTTGLHLGRGELFTAIAAVILAISTLISKTQLAQVPLGLYSIVRTGLGTMIFFTLALVLYGQDHFHGVLSPFLWQWMLLYGLIVIVVGQSLWLTGLRTSSVSMTTTVSSCTPIVGVLAAYLILGEVPNQAHYVGGSVILLGLLLSQIGLYRRTRRSPSPELTSPDLNPIHTEQQVESTMGFKGV
jgi:drug/metabolite transporter (DMT)-like permease